VRRALTAILGLGLALRLAHFWAISGTAYPSLPLIATELDMYATLEWAQAVLAGDWLSRDAYHPYFQWMRDLAPLETWHRWWGGKEIFQQAPLYVYLVALLLRLARHSLEGVLLIQLVLGALHPLVTYGLAKQLFDARVGLAAAALTAWYGPFIFHQGTLLRDWIPPILEPLALWLILRAQTTGRAGTWLSAGAVLGLAVLTKETVLLFLPLALLWILLVNRRSWPRAGRGAGLLLLGLLLVLSPLIWRNAVVGAPLLSISNRAPEGFIEGNAPDTYPIALEHPASMAGILERSQGDILRVIRETLAPYQGDWRRLGGLLLLKARGLVDPLEVPSNLDPMYALELSPPLRLTLTYGLIFPIGVVGMLASLRPRGAQALVLLYALAAFAGVMSAIIVARYRLVLVPLLLVYGAAALVCLWDLGRERRLGRLGGGLALVTAVAVAQHVAAPIPAVHAHPVVTIFGVEYTLSAQFYAGEGRFDRAVAEIVRLRTRTTQAPDFQKKANFIAGTRLWEGQYRVQWANQLFDRGMQEQAQAQVRLAQAAYAQYLRHSRAFELTFVPTFDLESPALAKDLFRLVLDLNPQDPAAGDLRRLIARLTP
jgi:hypothetical protein